MYDFNAESPVTETARTKTGEHTGTDYAGALTGQSSALTLYLRADSQKDAIPYEDISASII